jgi:hypothetical protein
MDKDVRLEKFDAFYNWLRSLRWDDENMNTTFHIVAARFVELEEGYQNDFKDKEEKFREYVKKECMDAAQIIFDFRR